MKLKAEILKTILTLCLVAASVFVSQAQRFNGYVILTSGDTLYGQVKQADDLFIHTMHYQVRFFPNGEDKKVVYAIKDIKGYKAGPDQYYVQDVVHKKDTSKILLKKIISGYCSLYEHWSLNSMVMNGVGTSSAPQLTYYLQREGEPAHRYQYRRLMKGLDLYFIDNTGLTYDIKMKKYRKGDIAKIVRRYNIEHKQKL